MDITRSRASAREFLLAWWAGGAKEIPATGPGLKRWLKK